MLVAVGLLAFTAFVAVAAIVAWPWRVDATLKAVTNATISLAGGVEVAGVSASAAAILGGPGVAAIHVRQRQVWKRPIARISLESLIELLQERQASPTPEPADPPKATASARAKAWLLSRTDLTALPELGLRVLMDLRDVSLQGTLVCGFSDPAITGKAAALLFPIAGMVAPLGVFDLSFDWSGRNRVEGGAELSFRVVPWRVALEGLRFVRQHVRFLSSSTPTLPTSITT